MEALSNVDRLVVILRQRLMERSRGTAGHREPAPEQLQRRQSPSAMRVLAAANEIDERHLRRALIQNLLSENLGERIVNEARFQQVVDRVTQLIEQDTEASRLMQRVVKDLKTAAR